MASNLEQDLFKKTVVELKAILRQRGQPTTGTKPILVQRIIETNLQTLPARDNESRLRDSVLAFIRETFDGDDFYHLLEEDADYVESRNYEDFMRLQEAELAQIDRPTLQMLDQLAVLI